MNALSSILLLTFAGVAAAAEPKPQFGAADWLPSETDSVGFAGQGNSWYPGANPPAEFWEGTPTTVEVLHRKVGGGNTNPYDIKKMVPGYADAKSKNILWKVPTPGISTSSPIVIGKRVITLHSPHFVICRDSDTGKILWQDELKIMTLPKLAADRKSLGSAPDAVQAKKLQWIYEIARSVYLIEQACQPDLRRANLTGATIKPLVPYIQAVVAGLERIKPKVVEAFPDAAVPLDKDIADAKKLIELSAEADKPMGLSVGAFPSWFLKQYGVSVHNCWPGYQISDTMSTPVSDGKIVGLQFGTGQTAAYDLETGKRLWAFRDPLMQATSVSHAPSPLLWKDLLIFNSGGAPGRMPSLLALDKLTGAFRWETKAGEKGCVVGGSHGDHMPHYLAHLSNGTATKAVVVSNGGAVIDAETGKKYIDLLPGTPGGRDAWGAGFVTGFGNLIFKTAAGDNFLPPTDSWELQLSATGTVAYVKRPPAIHCNSGQGPFAISDRIWVVNYNKGGKALIDPHSGLVWNFIQDIPYGGAGYTPTIAGNRLILTAEEANANGRERQDRMNLLKAVSFDVSDPAKPFPLAMKNLLGTADFPADILDTYFPEIASQVEMKEKLIASYHGLPPGFGVYMAGVTAHGNRLFILSQSHLYCIGPEALGSPKDDPTIVVSIAAAKDVDGLTQYLQAERPRYRRDALLRLATLKFPLNAEQQKQVQDLMINDPYEEVRAASVLALDVNKDAGAQQFLNAVIEAQKAKKHGQEDKLTPSLLLTARELGAAYFQDRIPQALAANKEFVARQALFLVASNVQLFTQPVIDAAIETLKQPDCLKGPERIHPPRQQNLADYLGLASVKDPRALTALRKSGLNPEQLMPALCHRLPVEELPSFIDEMIRSGKYMGYAWSADSQLNWFSRMCYRMGAAKAIPVLEKLKTDKPDQAKNLQNIIDGLTAK